MALVDVGMFVMQVSLAIVAASITTTSTQVAADQASLLQPQAKPNCPDRCGDLTIPYPFGIGDGCYRQLPEQNHQFSITCDQSTKPPSAYWTSAKRWTSAKVRVTNFNISEGELQIMSYIAKDCYDAQGSRTYRTTPLLRVDPPFTISSRKNKFFAVGCDTYAIFRGFRGEEELVTGCMSVCTTLGGVDWESCTGVGCCQTQVPHGLKNRTVRLSSYNGHKEIWSFNPCSYAFIVQDGLFTFNTTSFELLNNIQELPMVLNWDMGNVPCEVAGKRSMDYACKANSKCANRRNFTGGNGYYCQCLPGYEGNPYLGCQDIDECSAETNPCENGTCLNSPAGNYSCKCHKGFRSDGPWKCVPSPKVNNTSLKILLGISISVFVLMTGIFGIYCGFKRRQFERLKAKYFDANGGPKLLEKLSTQKESLETKAQIFTAEVLKKATNSYHESEKLGEGGYGTVYKGILKDERVVAIKKSKNTAQIESDQFVNEVVVLSQINHKNVVRLIGCCLETQMPLLVYEFVGNGTLYEHIHRINGREPLSWAFRLKIAAETASALSYLHHSTSIPIIHRDVKATNILLDEKFTAKVSDFGASRLVPEDPNQLPTIVQGTMGYLDPEYLQSNILTDKSDVYSFGVVLVELLTSKKVVSFDRSEEERNLANVFVSAAKKGMLNPILDDEIVKDGNLEIIEKVANLAKNCLSLKGDDRPSMKDVERELDGILLQTLAIEPGVKSHSSAKEIDHSLESSSSAFVVKVGGEDEGDNTTNVTSYDVSMENQAQMLKPFDDGR
ncbi:putative protein kinase RLK-Pelle-WAK family [Rosa chinensis]|uniref:Protein kinase domain-containing protein n=1 Tax=Rosa chinensis TaxID=74649 RepID=A0A2P6PMU0_ROSCH|nr:wall-associated receptor kinase 2 [Rosa chinensis]PRQ23248.1 putative protein kinase RLK-Pelle-WAK family [Rosa chinensis]